jgi:hypothetical protein
MSEQLALQQVFVERGAINLHERFFCAVAAIVDRGGNEFFACARFPADEDRGVGRRHLVDARVDLVHQMRIANHVFRLELFHHFSPKPQVFVFQCLTLHAGNAPCAYIVGNHCCHDREEAEQFLERGHALRFTIDRKGSDRFVLDIDWNANEAEGFVGAVMQAPLETGLLGHKRYDPGHACFQHLASDAFAATIRFARGLLRIYTLGRFDAQFPSIGRQEHNRAALDATALLQQIDYFEENLFLL